MNLDVGMGLQQNSYAFSKSSKTDITKPLFSQSAPKMVKFGDSKSGNSRSNGFDTAVLLEVALLTLFAVVGGAFTYCGNKRDTKLQEQSFKKIESQLNDPNSHVRWDGVKDLKGIKTPLLKAKLIVKVIDDSDPLIRAQAPEAIQSLSDSSLAFQLTQLYSSFPKDPNNDEQKQEYQEKKSEILKYLNEAK